MWVVFLAAGYGTRLRRGIEADATEQFAHLANCPKPLLPVNGAADVVLDLWVREIKRAESEGHVELCGCIAVTNDAHYALYEEWAARAGTIGGKSVVVLANGTADNNSRRGAVQDMYMACKHVLDHEQEDSSGSSDPVQSSKPLPGFMVIAGDTLFDFATALPDGSGLNVGALLAAFNGERDVVIGYKLRDDNDTLKRGILELESVDTLPQGGGMELRRVVGFLEKPHPSTTASRWACPAVYLYRACTVQLMGVFLREKASCAIEQRDAPGRFLQWLCNDHVDGKKSLFAACVHCTRYDIGALEHFKEAFAAVGAATLSRFYANHPHPFSVPTLERSSTIAVGRAYARVGFMGNPSDGYGGRTIAFTIQNFFAEVVVADQDTGVTICPNSALDSLSHSSLIEFHSTLEKRGVYGGMRLMKAALFRFTALVLQHVDRGGPYAEQWKNNLRRPLRLTYSTCIPRQVGLAGSSALILACWRALASFFHIPLQWLKPMEVLPQEVLDVERGLGIAAGLQDRVAQLYQGCMYMDFASQYLAQGYGRYSRIAVEALPSQLYLSYLRHLPSDSDTVHSDLRERWEKGEQEVVDAMLLFRDITERARLILEGATRKSEEECAEQLAELADENFNLRRRILGDTVVRECNLQMVQVAREHGYGAKFTGSGGAILCIARRDAKSVEELQAAMDSIGAALVQLHPIE